MRNQEPPEKEVERTMQRELAKDLPLPTTAFRRRSWLHFQRAIDPLAPPKPLRIERH